MPLSQYVLNVPLGAFHQYPMTAVLFSSIYIRYVTHAFFILRALRMSSYTDGISGRVFSGVHDRKVESIEAMRIVNNDAAINCVSPSRHVQC